MTSILKRVSSQSLGYFGAFFVLGMVISSLGPTLPYLAEQVRVDLSDAGALFSARSLGYMLGSFFLGRVYDRIPGNRLLLIVLLVLVVSLILTPISSVLAIMAVVMFISGLCLGGIDVGGNTMVMWQYRHKAGAYLNGLFLFAGIGGLIIPLIVGFLITNNFSFEWSYWFISFLIIPVTIWLIGKSSPTPPTKDENDTTKGVTVPLFLLFGLFFFLYVGIETSYGGWIYTYTLLNDAGLVPIASLMTSLFWSALTLGRLIAIPIASRVQPIIILQINLTGALISMGVILVNPQGIVPLAIGSGGLGLFLASTIPAAYSLAERRMHISGRLTGLLWACGSLGAIITPWYVGQLIELVTPIALMVTMFAYLGCMFILVGIISVKYKSQPI